MKQHIMGTTFTWISDSRSLATALASIGFAGPAAAGL